ncbi:hypothetical protein ACTPEM_23330, partial [Clostridioides difficile]
MPAPELFPVEEMKKVSVAVLEENGRSAMQYTTTEGYEPLREKIELKKVEDDNYKMNIQCDEQLQFDFIELIYNPQKDGKFLFSQ